MPLYVLALFVLVAIILQGIFVGCEIALVKVDKRELKLKAEGG